MFSRRIARLRAPVLVALILAFTGCDSTEPFTPDSSTPPDASDDGLAASPAQASAFAGGIPFGTFAQPTSEFGSHYNGAHRNIAPSLLVKELAAIKARGGRVTLMFAGSELHYKDGNGHFSLAKWKARVDRFRGVNFSSFINDGTIIAHYLLDEPQDRTNWNGQQVSPAVVEEMARYSKQFWPAMPTVVRVEPSYLASNHRYLDAAWAQYLSRMGPIDDYIREKVAAAQQRGLQLIVGFNLLYGGTNKTRMTASQLTSWGSTMLSNPYPCAFISWQYNSNYLAPSSIKSAMLTLRRKAESRSSKSCRSG
jgi:hypothetical protein